MKYFNKKTGQTVLSTYKSIEIVTPLPNWSVLDIDNLTDKTEFEKFTFCSSKVWRTP